ASSSSMVVVASSTGTTSRELEEHTLASQILSIQIINGVVCVAGRIELLQQQVCHTEGNGTEIMWRIGTPAKSTEERNVIVLDRCLHEWRRENVRE
ncbi:hypothetical protein PFISCL1PPCAC_2843, partial [Pristionchus fissidentatus]